MEKTIINKIFQRSSLMNILGKVNNIYFHMVKDKYHLHGDTTFICIKEDLNTIIEGIKQEFENIFKYIKDYNICELRIVSLLNTLQVSVWTKERVEYRSQVVDDIKITKGLDNTHSRDFEHTYLSDEYRKEKLGIDKAA